MQNSDGIKEELGFFKRFSTLSTPLVEKEIGGGFFRLGIEEAERRQAKHDIRWVEDALLELLRNSRDAKADTIAVATTLHEGFLRELVVIDNGEGVEEDYHEVIFEPRVTSRIREVVEDEYGIHGRGMALYAIRLNSKESRVCFSKKFSGTSIRAVFDLNRIPERKNQAERPKVVKSAGGLELRGQKNIAYTVLDFSLKNPGLSIYLGSNAEILCLVATLPNFSAMRLACGFEGKDANEFVVFAKKIGLNISTRTAYRILAGEIHPPLEVKRHFAGSFSKSSQRGMLPIQSDDWQSISQELRKVLEPYLKNYGLGVSEIRQVRAKERIKIQVILEPSDDFE